MRSIQKHLGELEELGVRPVAISVDEPQVSRSLCERRGYTYTFLSDTGTEVISRYDLLHRGAGIKGHDIARPAEFLLDSSGEIRWVNITNDFRVRARPEDIIRAARALQ